MTLSLEHARDVGVAAVFKGTRRAARLVREPGGVLFEYRDTYRESGGPAVATTLPLDARPVRTPGGAVPAFFAGLLPEGRRLTNLRRAVKTSPDDELSLLLAVGRDTIGDVQVVPEGEEPGEPPPLLEARADWSQVRFADVLASAGVVDPVAVPGVQEKASAAMISVPAARSWKRYVLKLDPPEYPHLVANEAWFLQRAREAGLAVVEAEVVQDAEGREGLLVERFDRVAAGNGDPARRAVEDGCQVLGRWPADKYRLSAEAVVGALADACAARLVALRAFFGQLVFAWLTGDGDVHAKNLAILAQEDGEWRAAPAYDLPSTLPYGDDTMALSVGGRRTGISRRRWLAFAERIGLPERAAVRVLGDLLNALQDLPERIRAGALPFAQKPTADLAAALRDRRRLLAGGAVGGAL